MEQYDYSKLLGRIKEKHYTQATLAKEIGLSEASLNMRLKNALDFKQGDILRIADTLGIPAAEIPAYFFTHQL